MGSASMVSFVGWDIDKVAEWHERLLILGEVQIFTKLTLHSILVTKSSSSMLSNTAVLALCIVLGGYQKGEQVVSGMPLV